jgi:hypothetical protein
VRSIVPSSFTDIFEDAGDAPFVERFNTAIDNLVGHISEGRKGLEILVVMKNSLFSGEGRWSPR